MPPPHTGLALSNKVIDLLVNWGIDKKLFSITLDNATLGDDVFLRNVASQMQGKFDKYWSDYSKILAMAVILDPCFKIQFVFPSASKKMPSFEATTSHDRGHMTLIATSVDVTLKGFKAFAKEDEEAPMSELEMFFKKRMVDCDKELDILDFWRSHEYS
ncbi:zinc finger BED domain-containing protein DAYSLEEPER-like isoform X2 [Malania oleifera]|uniref:zinc finger BED domain-containing protein DAYSLEEPER-like isoform X2 n=1 Tax=Malania oleifera TaxID=397392 RepID=UPI0025AEA85E|nr:zinc finger BED domain-containing protein DAYSLEEPER-like isoform X2 [Malania oleifera]XP_057971354.1 zinc finger BED domain-containing protein DAYSLEEPER-like isoform X2 [Malania oleifera]